MSAVNEGDGAIGSFEGGLLLMIDSILQRVAILYEIKGIVETDVLLDKHRSYPSIKSV